MTHAEQLAAFVVRISYDDLSEMVRQQLKIRILDALGCAIGALDGEPVRFIRMQTEDFGGTNLCSMIGGWQTSPDRTAFYNGALVRYLDFNDSYLAKGETCHPSDNLSAVLAAAEYANRSGREFLTALAVAYQVHCRLSDEAPVRARGFDHTTQGAYAVAAGVSKALGLDRIKTTNAIAMSGTAFNALRVTRTGTLSHWKGLAYPNTALGSTHAAFLAMRGITGPPEVFEGNKGFMEAIAGQFKIDWSHENLERVTQTILKRYNAEIHSQSAIEGILELKREHGFTAADIEQVEIEIFEVAYNIIGGGEEGDKTVVRTKEDADHSLPYIIAVALLDGHVMPEQYSPERIRRDDVQALLRKILVRPFDAYSRRFPEEMPCRIVVSLSNKKVFIKEKRDYEGFHTNPMHWETVVQKFERLSQPYTDASLRLKIIDTVAEIDAIRVEHLTRLLTRVHVP
ncbi:MAG: MmgE/PrpD family protein [wastewater metagenome]|nr:MmgE/PrpD family protein [Candidatus Loosdrechtia aerotolerans]